MVHYEHKVQYYETDGMGIVHHSNYIRWFEEARVDLLEQLGFGYDRIEEAGYSGPVLEVSCQYKTMSKFGETVRIEASITQYNGVRMTLHYDVYDKATARYAVPATAATALSTPRANRLSSSAAGRSLTRHWLQILSKSKKTVISAFEMTVFACVILYSPRRSGP